MSASNPVDTIDGLALVDARDTLASVKRGAAALRFALEALELHIDNLGALLDPIPPSSLIGENRS
jgi:hypothetical protein